MASWNGLKGRIRSKWNGVIARWAARPMHIGSTSWMLEHRPDFHLLHQGVDDYDTLVRAWMRNHTLNNSGDLARFYAIYLNLQQVLRENVSGAFAELGVYKGNSAYLFAHVARQAGRHLYLFDTFAGFDPRDFVGEDRSRRHGHFSDTSLEKVRSFVGESSVTYVPGFFPDSLADITLPMEFAVVHLDCDLYEPMLAGLQTFYPLLSPRGLMLLHDYSSGEWLGAHRAIDEFLRDKPESLVLLPDKSGTAILRKAG